FDEAIKPEVVKSYTAIVNSELFFKFVVNEITDFDEVEKVVTEYRKAGVESPVYVMPVGGTLSSYLEKRDLIANEALRRGFCFSPRLHVELWRNAWGK
ncbi:MAG: hypothetical protein KBC84_11010, partial [Proteobacteria bacterium]|nr:hypothetical protein [Pseudomonadota bacterium]